jgi:hypothetical protein
MVLDSAGTDGPTTEVNQVVTLEGNNTVQVQILAYVLTVTGLTIQLQSSNDLVNWTNQGSSKSMTAIGRKLLSSDTAVAASYVRVHFSLEGSGKVILNADLNVSLQ